MTAQTNLKLKEDFLDCISWFPWYLNQSPPKMQLCVVLPYNWFHFWLVNQGSVIERFPLLPCNFKLHMLALLSGQNENSLVASMCFCTVHLQVRAVK